VVDIIGEFKEYGIDVDVLDPWVNPAEAEREYGVTLIAEPKEAHYDAIIMAVAHYQFVELPFDRIRKYGKENVVIYDVKGILPRDLVDGCL
jgi:UDP-N-acetyl-D-galactosamine dehydrogenase